MTEHTLNERRTKPRISANFPVRVRGTARNGAKYETKAFTRNLSASGLYLQLRRQVVPGENLFMVIQFLNPVNHESKMANVAVKGVVARVEPLSNGEFGVGISMKQRRFL